MKKADSKILQLTHTILHELEIFKDSMITVSEQYLHSQHLLHFGTPRIHILDASLSLYPWEHIHSLTLKRGKDYIWAVLQAD